MAATYDPTLPTDRDHVRFLIGDTNVSSAVLTDEEIAAVLGLETATGTALPFFAAARCLEAIRIRYATAGGGKLAKTVSKLSIQWGVDGSAAEALDHTINCLRERGAFLLSPRPRALRML